MTSTDRGAHSTYQSVSVSKMDMVYCGRYRTVHISHHEVSNDLEMNLYYEGVNFM